MRTWTPGQNMSNTSHATNFETTRHARKVNKKSQNIVREKFGRAFICVLTIKKSSIEPFKLKVQN